MWFAILTNFAEFRLFDTTIKPYLDEPDRGLIEEFDLRYEDFAAQWEDSGPVIGQTFVDQPFYNQDPLGDQPRRIFKLSGILTTRAAVNYYFAGSARGFGALYLDGQPVLNIPGMALTPRFHAIASLGSGAHEFVIYYIRPNSVGQLVVDWQVPGSAKIEPMPKNAFGVLAHGRPGALEQYGKPDWITYCFTAGGTVLNALGSEPVPYLVALNNAAK